VPFGCLIAEQIGDDMPMTDAHSKSEVVARHASSALWNAQEHHKIFLLPVLKAIGSPWRFFRGRTGAKILAVICAVLAAIGIMAFVPWELTIEGKGSLLTDFRQNTYAPISGRVKKVFVDHGQQVKKGDVLVELYSPELDKEYQRLIEQRNSAELQKHNLSKQFNDSRTKSDERPQIQGQLNEAVIKYESAVHQLETIEEQFALMNVRAPFDGIVTSWDPKKEFNDRPVEIGTPLLSLADTLGQFILEVEVPDDDMGPILAAKAKLQADIDSGAKPPGERLDAYFVTAADPEHRYPGKVRHIATTAETVESKHSVKAVVEFDPKVREEYQARGNELRYGSEVRARIKCGKARLSYVLLRDVLQVWYETVLFRWPFLRNDPPPTSSS
jgi:multidrug efflux pump subunit AcrA (membrane-fusion protein)